MISDFDLGWLVGILEGEGCFGYYGGSQSISIEMTDEDVINKVAALFERILNKETYIVTRSDGRDDHKDKYRINITGDRARTIMRLVVRHMCYRRRAKIWQCLNGYKEPKSTVNLLSILGLREKVNE